MRTIFLEYSPISGTYVEFLHVVQTPILSQIRSDGQSAIKEKISKMVVVEDDMSYRGPQQRSADQLIKIRGQL